MDPETEILIDRLDDKIRELRAYVRELEREIKDRDEKYDELMELYLKAIQN